MTFEDIATRALVKNGILGPGEPLDAAWGQLALADGNSIIEEWNCRSVMIWTTDILEFPLTARSLPTYWYTIGPSGADFTAARPTQIKLANLILTGSNPPSRVPIRVINDYQFSDIPAPKQGTSPYPTTLYYSGDFPNSRIYLTPYPDTTGNSLELFVPNQVAAFAAVGDTFSFPPGFANAFMLTLSERLIEGVDVVSPSLALSASKARAYFASLNTASPKISTTDSGIPNGRTSGGNFFNGWPS